MKLVLATLLITTHFLLIACAPKTQSNEQIVEVTAAKKSQGAQLDIQTYDVLTRRILRADGKETGLSAYQLIRQFAGKRSIESPDLFSGNHLGQQHIFEDHDDLVGDHFVFVIHRDLDRDRGKMSISDRQRNEIKAYASSTDDLKGFENETMVYQWQFKANEAMELSRRFTHFFQLKAVGGNDSQPIITLSGAERSGVDGFEIRYHGGKSDRGILARTEWDQVAGEWLDIYVRASYSDSSSIRFIVKRVRDGKVLFNVDRSGLDLWRGNNKTHFVRPKWGIYRSLLDTDNLRSDEEDARFAHFVVTKVRPN